MAEQNKWASYEEANTAVLQGILDGIKEYVEGRHSSDLAKVVMHRIEENQSKLEQAYAAWITDEPSKFHLTFMARLVASYKTLRDVLKLNEAEVIDLLKQVFVEKNRASIKGYVEVALDRAPDPLELMIDISKKQEEAFFGETFEFERLVDNHQAYQVHYKTCFYHNFSRATGVPELMNVLCEWDWNWAAGIGPPKHGFWFERPTTMGYGGDVCRFYFFRITAQVTEMHRGHPEIRRGNF